ncbi:MAG: bifunctional hydroxymethylpyrimidine kinase/phosphomethylpyrimidine kinase [Bacteroidaceae bacterium]|nr:bifunctional hydroxymethylpyrimidine kinase/phosphomethylpyrimidine kinase [Bacteroidaceae bacterium]
MDYKRVLTIAGSDSGGGAGIQADIKTISALGCYAASAITAITVQNTLGVAAVHPLPADIIRGQISAVLDDIGADAIKIGMLGSAEAVLAVSEALRSHEARNVVLDPVMVSTSGHRLTEDSAVSKMCSELIPLATVITPNIPEAEVLLDGRKLQAQADLPDAVRQLSLKFGVSVLLKAGHLVEDRLVDYLFDASTGETTELPSQRIRTRNTHGTGCTLSSAIASGLAKGETLLQASITAKRYITEAIRAGADLNIGHGHGPVNHFYKLCR